MSQGQEKAQGTSIVQPASSFHETEPQAQKEVKRTWKSYIWSSKYLQPDNILELAITD